MRQCKYSSLSELNAKYTENFFSKQLPLLAAQSPVPQAWVRARTPSVSPHPPTRPRPMSAGSKRGPNAPDRKTQSTRPGKDFSAHNFFVSQNWILPHYSLFLLSQVEIKTVKINHEKKAGFEKFIRFIRLPKPGLLSLTKTFKIILFMEMKWNKAKYKY